MAETTSSLLLNRNSKRTTRGKVVFDPENPNAPVTLTVTDTVPKVGSKGMGQSTVTTYTQGSDGLFRDSSGERWLGDYSGEGGKVRAEMGKKINESNADNQTKEDWGTNATGLDKQDEGDAGGADGKDKGVTTENNYIGQMQSSASRNFGTRRYPKQRLDGQDYCKITQYKYVPGKFQPGKAGRPNERMSQSMGNVILPIPPGLSDGNQVSWANHDMNNLQMAGGAAALRMMNSSNALDQIGTEIGDFLEKAKTDENLAPLAKFWAMGNIPGINASTNQLLARGSGAVINPNTEVLFGGPQIRSFNYSFRMTPRSSKEASSCQKIIRFFKQGMAVQESTDGGMFLVSPNVFHVQFYNDKGAEHPFIGKLKKAACTGFTVNYVPDGTYMTLPDSSMTAYEIGISLMELEPIYESDYDEASTVGF